MKEYIVFDAFNNIKVRIVASDAKEATVKLVKYLLEKDIVTIDDIYYNLEVDVLDLESFDKI